MFSGELIHNLTVLPSILEKEEYKSYLLQTIIKIESLEYLSHNGKHSSSPIQSTVNTSDRPKYSFQKQVQYLVVLKQNLFLPKLSYIYQLHKDVGINLMTINDKQVLCMAFSPAQKTFLFIV
jgi:hypothetical protein